MHAAGVNFTRLIRPYVITQPLMQDVNLCAVRNNKNLPSALERKMDQTGVSKSEQTQAWVLQNDLLTLTAGLACT